MSLSSTCTSPEEAIAAVRGRCAVCRCGDLEPALELPNLPLTGIFRPGRPGAGLGHGVDQVLLICRGCGHAQLLNRLNPSILYGSDYGFRTSSSHKAM